MSAKVVRLADGRVLKLGAGQTPPRAAPPVPPRATSPRGPGQTPPRAAPSPTAFPPRVATTLEGLWFQSKSPMRMERAMNEGVRIVALWDDGGVILDVVFGTENHSLCRVEVRGGVATEHSSTFLVHGRGPIAAYEARPVAWIAGGRLAALNF